MSFILDALRRAEQERNLGKAPSLQATTSVEPKTKQNILWPWGAIIVVLLCSNILLWTQWWQKFLPGSSIVQLEKTSLELAEESPAVIDQITKKTANQVLPDSVWIENNVNPLVEVESLSSKPLTQKSLTSSKTLLPYQALSLDARQNFPDLSLDIHVFSDKPERRFVLLNGKRYQQGDWLDEGPLLESITEQGVILVYQDQRFELAAQR